jgi:hypothetical protein
MHPWDDEVVDYCWDCRVPYTLEDFKEANKMLRMKIEILERRLRDAGCAETLNP